MQVLNLKRFVLKNSWFAGEQKIVGLILSYQLLGGFKYVLIFTRIPGEMIQLDDIIFFKWVVQPPTRLFRGIFCVSNF